MKRNDYSRIIIYAIILLVFNVIYFMTGGIERETAGWIAYTFSNIAIIISGAAPFLCIHYKRIPENLVTIYIFAWLYTILCLIFNGIIIVVNSDHATLCLIVNLILLAVYVIQLIVNMNVNHAVEKNLETVDAEREFVHTSAKKLKMCMQFTSDDAVKRTIEKAYDAVRTSPLHSTTQVMDYEVEIVRLISELEHLLDLNTVDKIPETVDAIVRNVKKRNAML